MGYGNFGGFGGGNMQATDGRNLHSKVLFAQTKLLNMQSTPLFLHSKALF